MNDIRRDLGTTRLILEESGFGRERTISLHAPITGPVLFVQLIILVAHASFQPVLDWVVVSFFWDEIDCLVGVLGHSSAIIDEEA